MKKIYDITPPQVQKRMKLKKIEKPNLPQVKISLRGKWKMCLGLLALALIGVISYFILPKAEIEIFPQTQDLNLEEKITADCNSSQIIAKDKILPAELLEEEKSETAKFYSSGTVEKEEKAKGKIIVYDNYSTSPQVLVKKTRFVSKEGKLFRLTKGIKIPGQHYQEGKLVPGSIEAEVEAAEAGEDYNIPPSTFSVLNFSGTAKYTKFWAQSSQPMSGGVIGEFPQATSEDLKRAEKTLSEELFKKSEVSLKKGKEKEFVLLAQNFHQEIAGTSSSVEAGGEAPSFDYRVKVISKALVFKEEDLKQLVKEYLNLKLGSSKEIWEESLKISYNLVSPDFDSGKISLGLKISAKSYSKIDFSNLKQKLRGKTQVEAKDFLINNYPTFSDVKVKFWPFWVKAIPRHIDRIEVKILIES